MTIDRDDLRARSDALAEAEDAESDDVIEVNRKLFHLDATDKDACNRLAIALVNQGKQREAREVLVRGLDANPVNAVGEGRLKGLPEVTAEEIVESMLEELDGPERAVCLSFMAESIRDILRLDNDALAVAESPRGFLVWGGKVCACQPNGRLLNMKLHEVGSRGLIERIEAAGGRQLGETRRTVPHQVWIAIPIEQLEALRDEIMESHRRHLVDAIEAGKNPHLARGRHDLRDYILREADKAAQAA